ncbi:MAG TPA: diguanylate cyclase [Acidiferrobacterales bacterium]
MATSSNRIRAGLMLVAALAVCALPAGDAAAHTTEVRIAVLAHRGDQAALDSWQATADYLTRAIPSHRFVIVPLMNKTLGPAVAEQQVDFVLTNPGSYVGLESQYGVTRMLTLRNLRQGRPYTEFGAVIFTRADRDDIRTLANLKGKSFMGVGQGTFGGFQMAWLELQNAGVDPFKHFERLEFAGLPQDTIVYAVRDAKVDAGTVRTDTLERMAAEGKIDLAQFKVIGARRHEDFPFLISTRLYPEWAFARLKHVSEELAQKVAVALLSLPPDSRAARTSQSAGWTVPRDYTPVHELFKALRVGPYKDLGKVSFVDVVRHYWPWILVLILAMALMVANILYIRRLNRYLKEVTLSLEKSNIELQRLSTQDGLTGVANHRLFEETLAREWARAARERAPLSIVMIDIDHFKLLNDSDGHLAGDDCLKRVAQALNQAVRRPADFLARYGGEEFIAILPGTDMDGATMVAERLREAVEDSHLVNRGTGRFVTVSLGVASAVPSPGTSGEVLVATADRAMYQAKEAGRNQVRRAA